MAGDSDAPAPEPWDIPVAATFIYSQDGDAHNSAPQQFQVQVIDGYLVLSTERWALDADEIDRFATMLREALAGRPGMRNLLGEEDADAE